MSFGSERVLHEDQALPLLKAAWDAGIQTWDTADGHSNVPELVYVLTAGYIGNAHWQAIEK
jgi:aryl-alcohol dehydrogenase-like predicted oxidoreductase